MDWNLLRLDTMHCNRPHSTTPKCQSRCRLNHLEEEQQLSEGHNSMGHARFLDVKKRIDFNVH